MGTPSRLRIGPVELSPFAAIAVSVNLALAAFGIAWLWTRAARSRPGSSRHRA